MREMANQNFAIPARCVHSQTPAGDYIPNTQMLDARLGRLSRIGAMLKDGMCRVAVVGEEIPNF